MSYTKKEREELIHFKTRFCYRCMNRQLTEQNRSLAKIIRNRERQNLIQAIRLKKGKSIRLLLNQYYIPAYSVYATGTIWLLRIPRNCFMIIENGIEEIIEHETLHLIFYRVSHKEVVALAEMLDSMNMWCASFRKGLGLKGVWSFSDQVDFIMQWFPSQELVKDKPSAGAPSRMLFLRD